MDGTPLMVAAVLFIASLIFIGHSEYHRRAANRVAEEDPSPIADVSPNSDVVIEGQIPRDTDAYSAPVSQEDAVCFVWRADTLKRSRDDPGTYWDPEGIGVVSLPFTVEDDTGEIRVDIGDHGRQIQSSTSHWSFDFGRHGSLPGGYTQNAFTVDLSEWASEIIVAPDSTPPKSIRNLFQRVNELSPSNKLSLFPGEAGSRRYRDSVLSPGDSCYIAGTTDENGVLTPACGGFFLGKGTYNTVMDRHSDRVRRSRLVAVGAFLFGLYWLGLAFV